ncbi:MAG: flippase-like domain-containing protein [Verrucomicrobia bacterium]|nr:flippase-like domain-containing protein [Verrucomicrobiota bacterium]
MKRALKIFLLLLGLALFAWFVQRAGVDAIADAFRKLGWLAPVALLPYALVYIFDTLGWFFAFGLGAPKPGYLQLLRVRWAGEAVNNVVPSGYVGGEAVKVFLLHRRGFPTLAATTSVVIGKTVQVSAQVIFIALGACLALLHLPEGSPARHGMAVVAALAVGMVLALFWIQSRGLFSFVHALVAKLPFRVRALEKREAHFRELDDRIFRFYYQSPKVFAASGLCYLAGWLCDALELFVVSRLLGFPLEFTQCVAIESFISVAKALGIFVPAAMGVQESGVVLLFNLFGLTETQAITYAILRRGREVVYSATGAVLLYSEGGSLRGLSARVAADGKVSP